MEQLRLKSQSLFTLPYYYLVFPSALLSSALLLQPSPSLEQKWTETAVDSQQEKLQEEDLPAELPAPPQEIKDGPPLRERATGAEEVRQKQTQKDGGEKKARREREPKVKGFESTREEAVLTPENKAGLYGCSPGKAGERLPCPAPVLQGNQGGN